MVHYNIYAMSSIRYLSECLGNANNEIYLSSGENDKDNFLYTETLYTFTSDFSFLPFYRSYANTRFCKRNIKYVKNGYICIYLKIIYMCVARSSSSANLLTR